MHYPLALGRRGDRQSALGREGAQGRPILEPATDQASAAPSTGAFVLARIRAAMVALGILIAVMGNSSPGTNSAAPTASRPLKGGAGVLVSLLALTGVPLGAHAGGSGSLVRTVAVEGD